MVQQRSKRTMKRKRSSSVKTGGSTGLIILSIFLPLIILGGIYGYKNFDLNVIQ